MRPTHLERMIHILEAVAPGCHRVLIVKWLFLGSASYRATGGRESSVADTNTTALLVQL